MKNKIFISESILGNWNYHISLKEKPYQSVCGKQVMKTQIPLDYWGVSMEHIGEKYCEKCSKFLEEKSCLKKY